MGRLTNAALENCTVYNWETGETGGIWDKMGLSARRSLRLLSLRCSQLADY